MAGRKSGEPLPELFQIGDWQIDQNEGRIHRGHEIDSVRPRRMVQNGKSITAAGWYADSLRRVDGKRKFVERNFHIFHMVLLDKSWA